MLLVRDTAHSKSCYLRMTEYTSDKSSRGLEGDLAGNCRKSPISLQTEVYSGETLVDVTVTNVPGC